MNSTLRKVAGLALCGVLCGVSYQAGILHGKRSGNPSGNNVSEDPLQDSARPAAPDPGLALHQAALLAATAPAERPNAPSAETNPPSITIPRPILQSIKEYSKKEGKAYAAFLSAIGASDETIAHAVQGREDVHLASCLAELAVIDLSQARRLYDERIRKELGPERYAQYRDFEKNKPFRIEVDEISDYLGKRGFSGDLDRALLSQTLKEANAFTTSFSDGPYDRVPNPTAYIADGVPIYTQRLQQVTEATPRLAELLSTRFPPEVVQQVNAYFQSRVNELRYEVQVTTRALEERMRGETEETRERATLELSRKMAELEAANPRP